MIVRESFDPELGIEIWFRNGAGDNASTTAEKTTDFFATFIASSSYRRNGLIGVCPLATSYVLFHHP
jgi:hypothetical protein